jgi:fused signal recognition particle receptor
MFGVLRGLRDGLAKTRKNFTDKVGSLVLGEKIDEAFLDELEEALIASDVGVETASLVLKDLKERFKRNELSSPAQVKDRLRQILFEIISTPSPAFPLAASPSAVLVVGVNGTGKTTTIGKLAKRLQSEGKKVMLAAGDTGAAASNSFRSGGARGHTGDQTLEGRRSQCRGIRRRFRGQARAVDVLIVDTGRPAAYEIEPHGRQKSAPYSVTRAAGRAA